MVTPEQIVAEARSWLGTRFRKQGRLKAVSTDCVGLIVGTAKSLNLPVQDYRAYDTIFPDTALLQAELARQFERAPGPHAGAIILLEVRDEPTHVGIATEAGTYVHAWHCRGVVETKLYPHQVVGSFRYKGVAWPP